MRSLIPVHPILLSLLTTLMLVLTGCTFPYTPAGDSVALPPEEIAGCFEINYLGRVFDRTGKQIRLSTELGAINFEHGEYLVRPLSVPIKNQRESSYRRDFSFWKPVGPGRIIIIWTDGFHVTEMKLDVYAHDLRGVAAERGDVVVSEMFTPRSKVILRRIACS